MNVDPRDINDDPAEREWQAQELALQQERFGRITADNGMRVQRYRMLARALLQPLDIALPSDFAREVARRAEVRAGTRSAFGCRFELVLSGTLIAVFGVAVGVIVTFHGSHWLHPFVIAARALASPWGLALVGCVGMSIALERWRSYVQA
jgi:ABC-type dipeptide/oligopeptide/nickel transport system permease component